MDNTFPALAKLLHDFKSPLTSTKMGLQFILEGRAGQVDQKTQKILQDVLQRNQELLDKILTFEKEHG